MGGFLFAAVFTLVAASGFFGYGVVDTWHERLQLRQRPRAGQRGQGGDGSRRLEGGRPGRTGRDPAPPGVHADQTGAELRTHRAGQDRRPSGRLVPVPRGIEPVPGQA